MLWGCLAGYIHGFFFGLRSLVESKPDSRIGTGLLIQYFCAPTGRFSLGVLGLNHIAGIGHIQICLCLEAKPSIMLNGFLLLFVASQSHTEIAHEPHTSPIAVLRGSNKLFF